MPDSFLDPKSLQEFERNLRRVNNFTDPAIAEGLERGANLVVQHAQANHPRPGSKAAAKEHIFPRFYTWRGITAASIHAGEVKSEKKGAEIEVISPESHSAALEFGTPTARAFPFMGPALEGTQEKVFRELAASIAKVLGG